MSEVSDKNEGMEQKNIETSEGPSGSEADQHASQSDDSPNAEKEMVVIVADNYKYIFRSQNLCTNIQSWRCSFKTTCKATINVSKDGDVIWASDDHSHAALSSEQIQAGSLNEMLLHKEMIKCANSDTIDSLREIRGNFSDDDQNLGSGSAQTVAAESDSEEGNQPKDSAQLEAGCRGEDSFEEQESMLPRLGPAFSFAGHKDDIIMMNPSEIQQTKWDKLSGHEATTKNDTPTLGIDEQGIPVLATSFSLSTANQTVTERTSYNLIAGEFDSEQSNISKNDEQNLAWSPKSLVLHEFSVAKSTQTMRNILAQALERLDGERLDEPAKNGARPSKRSRRRRNCYLQTTKTDSDELMDMHTKMEEEWQWQLLEPAPHSEDEEEEDEEINVEV